MLQSKQFQTEVKSKNLQIQFNSNTLVSPMSEGVQIFILALNIRKKKVMYYAVSENKSALELKGCSCLLTNF